MSDSKLRELERRWRETGSVEDEAAYLRERVRVGDLTQERLELAAYCGHEGARRAVAQAPYPPKDPVEFALTLPGRNRLLLVLAAICSASLALTEFEARHPSDNRPRAAILAARAWLLCPCSSHAHAVEACLTPADLAALHTQETGTGELAHASARAAEAAAATVTSRSPLASTRKATSFACIAVEPSQVRERMARALAAWALQGHVPET